MSGMKTEMSADSEKEAGSVRSARVDSSAGADCHGKTEDPSDLSGQSPAEYIVDPAEEKAVLRKIDFIIMPAMTFVYFFQCEELPLRVTTANVTLLPSYTYFFF